MFHFHICILSETKFWTTNREHNIGMCSLLLGPTGNIQFIPLHHCTIQTSSIGEHQQNPDLHNSKNHLNINNSSADQHNTSTDSSSSLSDKLSGVLDPEEISKLIRQHAEQVTRPSPTPKDRTPVPSPPASPKEKFAFIQHGIKWRNKCVRKFNCVLCSATFGTQKELNTHIGSAHSEFKFTCRYCSCQYQSANSCAKHEKSHVGYDFECEFYHK